MGVPRTLREADRCNLPPNSEPPTTLSPYNYTQAGKWRMPSFRPLEAPVSEVLYAASLPSGTQWAARPINATTANTNRTVCDGMKAVWPMWKPDWRASPQLTAPAKVRTPTTLTACTAFPDTRGQILFLEAILPLCKHPRRLTGTPCAHTQHLLTVLMTIIWLFILEADTIQGRSILIPSLSPSWGISVSDVS